MNTKDGVADGTSTYAMNRLLYSKKTYEPILKKKWGASDSSETTQRNRMMAVGKTVNSDGFTTLSHTKGEVVKTALQRVRSSGSSVPKKFAIKNTKNPMYVPDPPLRPYATYGNSSITISFVRGDINGSELINYLYSLDGITYTEFSPATTSNSVTVTGLTNGTTYTIYLKAKNSVGVSRIASPSVTETPSTVPNPPTSLSATPNTNTIQIDFTAGSNGGSEITNYSYSLDETNYTALSPSDNTSPITISGLDSATSYTVRLKAMNKNGSSVASAAITTITTV